MQENSIARKLALRLYLIGTKAILIAHLVGVNGLPLQVVSAFLACVITVDKRLLRRYKSWFLARPAGFQTRPYSVSQISVINDLVGAIATRATVWAIEREFSYWDATPVVSHINLRTAITLCRNKYSTGVFRRLQRRLLFSKTAGLSSSSEAPRGAVPTAVSSKQDCCLARATLQ